MAQIKWIDGTIATALDTDLNSLASGGRKQSAAIDNDAGLDLFCDLELLAGWITTAPAAGAAVASVWLLPTVDGTNFPEPTEVPSPTVDPQSALFVGTFTAVKNQTAAQRMVLPGIQLPPRDFRLVLKNVHTTAMAATLNTLKLRPYKLQSV